MGSFDDLDLKVAEKFGKGWAASAAEHVKLSGGVNPDGWWVRPASIGQHAPPHQACDRAQDEDLLERPDVVPSAGRVC